MRSNSRVEFPYLPYNFLSCVVYESMLTLGNCSWHFVLIYFSKPVSVSKLWLMYILSTYMCVCVVLSVHRHCHSASLVLLNHFSRALLLFLFLFLFTLCNVVSLLFVSAASGACLGKTSCKTPHPPTIWFSIHMQTCTQQEATHTHQHHWPSATWLEDSICRFHANSFNIWISSPSTVFCKVKLFNWVCIKYFFLESGVDIIQPNIFKMLQKIWIRRPFLGLVQCWICCRWFCFFDVQHSARPAF